MKKKGSVCDYSDERNRELRRVYRDMLADKRLRTARAVYEAVARQPASRFYVSESRALSIIRHKIRCGEFPISIGNRIEMFNEIWKRYELLRRRHTDRSDYDLIFEIVNSPAPSFYLTPGSIRTILSRA